MKYPKHIVKASEKRMHDDFRYFLFMLWQFLGLPQPTKVQYDIAHYLQTGDRRIVIEAFRGVGKSWITAAFVLWHLWKDPQHRFMVVSANKERAAAFTIFVRRLITEVPLLRHLVPKDGQLDSQLSFEVAGAKPDQAPSVKSVGIKGQLTGGRANTIIADDIEVPKNSATETQREQISELVKEFDAVLKPNGRVIYLGTPQVADSLYVKLETRGYIPRIWSALYPLDTDVYRGFFAPSLVQELRDDPELKGKPTDPQRFDALDLSEREASYGRSGFALQFMLDTSISDANKYPLKLRDLIIMDVPQSKAPVSVEWAAGSKQIIDGMELLGMTGDRVHEPMYVSDQFQEYDGSVMFIDPSGRGKDETAYCVVKMLKGMIYVRRWGGLLGGYDESTLMSLAVIAREEQVNAVHIEANYGDGMFTKLFSPVIAKTHPCTLEEYKVSGQKEKRIIDKLEPCMNQHRLIMDTAILRGDFSHSQQGIGDSGVGNLFYCGTYQMTHITGERGALRQDDRIDVLAEAVGYWQEHLGLDIKKSEGNYREKLFEEELKQFMKAAKATAGKAGGKRFMRNRSNRH